MQPPHIANAAAPPKLTAAQKAAIKAAQFQARVLQLAPADEYFGPLKQSVIGINNTIRTLGWNYDVNHDIGDSTFKSAGLTERALRDWAHKYPKDDQVPRSIFLLQRLYTKVLTQQSRDHAHEIAQWLFNIYGKSPQAKQLKKTLAYEHLAPVVPPGPAATPTPAYSSVFGPMYPSEFSNTPLPVATPVALPAASPAASAGPSIASPAPQPSPSH